MNNPKNYQALTAWFFAAAVLLACTASALAATHYVDVNSTNATPPYTDWSTAATNIQDAVDAAAAGDEVVVTNGLYGGGVNVNKPLRVRSVNGPQSAVIDGGGSWPCVNLATNASLSGFTLTNGLSLSIVGLGGGGVRCAASSAVVSNCVITGNVAGWIYSSPVRGGGAYGGTLNNCTLSGNSAYGDGGGACGCMLNNCTLSGNSTYWCGLIGCTHGNGGGAYGCTLDNCSLSGNSASSGGGASGCTLNNSIAFFNSSNDGVNYDSSCTLNFCCTTPLPTNGLGNITNAPLFVDLAGGNLRLQFNSPCINAGYNGYAPAVPDLDGNPRIAGGTVDIGAYEFQEPVSRISYAWLYQYGLPINAATDTADPDGDGVDNYHEWLAGTDPTNPFSFPPLLTLVRYGANVILTWTTNAFGFTVQSTTNLGSAAVWSTNSPRPVVIGGQNVVINPISGPQQFYRLVH